LTRCEHKPFKGLQHIRSRVNTCLSFRNHGLWPLNSAKIKAYTWALNNKTYDNQVNQTPKIVHTKAWCRLAWRSPILNKPQKFTIDLETPLPPWQPQIAKVMHPSHFLPESLVTGIWLKQRAQHTWWMVQNTHLFELFSYPIAQFTMVKTIFLFFVIFPLSRYFFFYFSTILVSNSC